MLSKTQKLVSLALIAATPRILGALFLPNAFGDAYVYIQEIGTLSTKISTGAFRLVDLFGFWLPLYQFIAALLNIFVRNGFYSGKIVAAIFGACTCVFVYLVTQQLTKNDTAALMMFVLIALNPLHVFYSASAMTDVPHAFFVIATLYFVMRSNWIVAAVFAALAGCTRVESWMLIPLIPFIQFVRERRVSIIPILILIIPPLLWFYISWKATGNWLACFVQRQEYHDWLMQMNPALARFSVFNAAKDTATWLFSSDIAVLMASFFAAWFVLRRAPQLIKLRAERESMHHILPPVLFFCAFFALLLVAYLTHQQPIIFPRYGLILFMLGLPMLAWTFLHIRSSYPQIAQTAFITIIAIMTLDASIQFAGAVGTVNQYRAQRSVADYLRDHFDAKSDSRIFCDEGTVRVLSGLPEARFVTSSAMGNGISVVSDNNGGYLGREESHRDTIFAVRASRLEYVVVANVQGSLLSHAIRQNGAPELAGFEPVFHSESKFLPTNIWVMKNHASNSQ